MTAIEIAALILLVPILAVSGFFVGMMFLQFLVMLATDIAFVAGEFMVFVIGLFFEEDE